MNKLLYICVLLLCWSLPAVALPPDIPDQRGDLHSLADAAGAPVLAIVVSGRKLRHIQRWEEKLRAEFPELASIRVADIREEPRPTFEQVAGKLQKRVPDGVSLLIDLQNVWASEYGLDTGEPCLLLFSADGELVQEWRGRAKSKLVAEVRETLASIYPSGGKDSADE